MSDLKGDKSKLGSLFSHEYFFEVPEYQRPFRWDDDNLTELATDLIDADQSTEYFLGTIVLHETHDGHYDIVDGQQRLTALCILIACLRDSPQLAGQEDWTADLHGMVVQSAKPVADIPERVRINVRDSAVFDRIVATRNGTLSPKPSTKPTPVEKRYLSACEIFHSKLADLDENDLMSLAKFVSERCLFMYLATDDFKNAFRLFTIINDRGMQLRRIDVLKSHNLTPEAIANAKTRSRYAKKWEAMEETLGEDEFESIFPLLRLIYLKAKPQADLLTEFEDRILGKKNKPKHGTSFIDALETYSDIYNQVFLDQDVLDETADEYRYRSMISIMTDHFIASEWKSCCIRFIEKFGTDSFFQFLMKLEKVYLAHWVQSVRKDERYDTYVTILGDIDRLDKPEAVIDEMTFDSQVIVDACANPNFYGAGYSKYMLLRLEVLASELEESHHFIARSVEHVLPQTPPDGSQWARDFPTEDDLKAYVHQSGNLVLLSKSKNSAAGNKALKDKQDKYLKKRVSDYPRSVQVLAETSWDKTTIDRRTAEIQASILSDPEQ